MKGLLNSGQFLLFLCIVKILKNLFNRRFSIYRYIKHTVNFWVENIQVALVKRAQIIARHYYMKCGGLEGHSIDKVMRGRKEQYIQRLILFLLIFRPKFRKSSKILSIVVNLVVCF